MAVEIPVVIDIEGAFKEAARGVPSSMKVVQEVIDQNTVKIRVDNTSIKSGNEELERLGAWYRRLENADWSKIGAELDLSPFINRAILKLQELEGKINEIQELRWSEGGRGDFSFAAEYNSLTKQIEKAKAEVIALEQTQQKMTQAAGVNFSGYVRDISRTNIELLQMKDYYERLEAASDKWARAVNPAVLRHIEGLTEVNFELLRMREYYARIEQEATRLSDSVNGYQARISELNAKWNSMTKAERDSEKGRAIYEQYKKEAQALEDEAATLDRMRQMEIERTRAAQKEAEERIKIAQKEAEEKRKAEERELKRINDLRNKGTQSRRYENAVLNSTVKTMRILQEQERILSSRLQSTPVGSTKYKALAAQLVEVRKELASASALAKRGGAAYRDFGNSAARSATQVGATTAALSAQSGVMKMLTGYLSGYTLLFAGARFVHNVRQTTAELEMQRVALGGILNDTEKANDLFRQIKAAALKSPFEIKDLVTFTKQLSAYQIETSKLFDTTMKLADVSAGLGVDMNRLILAYGQVRAASVLRGQELRQFTEAGIPLVEKLAEKFRELGREGTTTADVFDLISKRAVPFSMIEDIFNDMTSAGGVFYNMQEKQSETLKGQWMKLRDAVTIMYDEIGNTKVVHNAMTSLIDAANNMTRSWREVANWAKSLVAAIVTYNMVSKASVVASNAIAAAEARRLAVTKAHALAMPKFIAAIVGETKAKQMSRIATHRLAVAQYKLATATTVAEKALMRLWIAIIKNPYAAAAAAAVGLVAGIVAIVKNTREATITIDELEQSVSKFETSLRKQRDVNRLATLYEELSKKSERTAEETEQLRRVTNELGKTFPSAVSGINKETGALEINIDKVRSLTKAEQELELARLGREEKRATSRITELQEERQRILDDQSRGKRWAMTPIGYAWVNNTEEDLANMGQRLQEINGELGPLETTLERIQNLKIELGIESPEDTSAKKTLTGWKQVLAELQEEKVKAGAPTVFTPGDIENMKTIQDLWKATKKGITETTTELNGLRNIQKGLTGDAARSNENAIKLTEKELELYNAIKAAFGFVFTSGGGGSSYTQDPFINQMQERIKFMKDFKKGYDDLNKYLSSTDALSKTADKLRTRGLSLGIEAAEQQKAAKELSQWYGDTIDSVYAEVQKKYKMTGPVESFLSQQIKDTTNRGKALRDFQKLLQSLFDEKTDLDVSELKKSLENDLKKVQDEIKRSETAKKFYENILGMTGDETLSADMTMRIYGDTGDLAEQMRQQLSKAFVLDDSSITVDDSLKEKISNAIAIQDYKTLRQYLQYVVDDNKKAAEDILDNWERADVDYLQGLYKTYEKTKTYEERITAVRKREQTARLKIASDKNLSDAQKAEFTTASQSKEAKEIAEIQLEALKDTYTWTKAFEDMDGVSSRTLENLINLIDEYINKYGKSLEPQQLKELARQRENAKQQLNSRNAYKAAGNALKDLAAARERVNNLQKDGKEKSEDYTKALDDEKEAVKRLGEALSEIESEISDVISSTKDLMSVFASDDDASFFGGQLDNISKALGGLGKAGVGIAQLAAGDVTPQAIIQTITGISDVIASVFGAAQAFNLRRIDKELKRQDDLLEDLSYSYDRLGEAMERAFGSDYIYNYSKQLENLTAQLEAYNTQAALEREKGKKADADKIKDYENNARDAQKAIEDMSGQLAEFFSGTDLTSAAQDFANAWIEAYKEFGSTTDAMKEKFQEMIENMVTQSLGAKIMQTILQPLFDEIDEMARSGGELSAAEIAELATATPEYIARINDAMTTMMSQLTAAGYNMRQQPGGFTGISRSIAGASEESINGLAAGINTQNFYMSLISQNVAAILAAMTGEQVEGATAAAAVPDTYKEQMLEYAGSLPQMRDDMASIRAMLSQVIKPRGVSASHYVATNL